MDWPHMATTLLVAVMTLVKNMTSECPTSYWDEPSKRCASFIASVLDHVRIEDIRINKTCGLWQRTNTCYQQLMTQCRNDITALNALQAHVDRFRVYSLLCATTGGGGDHRQHNQKLVECFLPYMKPTHTCTEAFDKYFRNFVADKQYRNACRVLSTAMKCFHEIQLDISAHCPSEISSEYRRNYISPLVDQTRQVVLARCAMSPPYEQYFTATAPSSDYRTHRFNSVCATVFALSFVRWRRVAAASCAFPCRT